MGYLEPSYGFFVRLQPFEMEAVFVAFPRRVSQDVMGPCPVDYLVEGMGRVEEIGMEEVLVQQIGKLACVDVFRLLVIQQGDVYGEACDFQGFFVDVDAEQVVLGYIPVAIAECLFILVAVQFYFFFDHPSQGLD